MTQSTLLTAICHCGATRIELPRAPEEARTCNCSFCHRTGAVWAYFDPDEVTIATQAHDRVYSASGGMNQHHFCGHCGGNTHGDGPDWASAYNADGTPKGEAGVVPKKRIFAVNMRMVDGFDLAALPTEAMDGRNNW